MATAVALVREHGLLDAKELVRRDASALKDAAPKVAARLAAEAAAAAEFAAAAAAASAAPVPRELAAAADAVKRSPLMLALPGDHPGLASLADLVRFCAGAGTLSFAIVFLVSQPRCVLRPACALL